MFAGLLELPEMGEVIVLQAVHADDGFAPLLLPEAKRIGRLAVEHGPVAAQGDAALLEHLGQHLVAAAGTLDVLAKEVRAWEMLVLAEHPAKRHDALQRAARQHKATAAVGIRHLLLLLLGEDGRAKVVGAAGVEVGQEAVQVVVVDVRVELDEDEPVRLGAHVRGPLHHGQVLVLVEAGAGGGALLGHVVVLDAVVDVEVGVVELVLGAQVGEGVGDVEAAVRVLAVREDEQVLLAAAQAVEVGGQLRGDLAGANLEDDRHVAHDAGAEGRAFLAIVHRGRRPGENGRGPLDEQLEAALPAEEGADERGEEEDSEHQRSAQQAQRRQSHHHGGAGAAVDRPRRRCGGL